MKNSWQINRRQMLKGSGVALALPFLESMAWGADKGNVKQAKRLVVVYKSYGVFAPNAKDGIQDMSKASNDQEWWPCKEAGPLKFNAVQKPFEPLKNYVSYLEGLDHAGGYTAGGHAAGDVFATGAFLGDRELTNNISIDQVAAKEMGHHTRYPSMVLGTEGGTGAYKRSFTLSHYGPGRPIPSMNDPMKIYNSLFSPYAGKKVEEIRQELANKKSMLDRILNQYKRFNSRLGKADKEKMDEYLTSIRAIEKRIERIDQWTYKPVVQPQGAEINLEVKPEDPEDYIRCMYDLIFLAMQTDSTRFATFMTESEQSGRSPVGHYLKTLFGWKGDNHALSHDRNAEFGPKWDNWRAKQHAYFLQRLKDTKEGESNMLDNTVVLWGSAHPHSAHNTRNYPLQIAGGNKLGFKHGNLHKFIGAKKVPLANLFVSMLNAVDVPVNSFADSSGDMKELRPV